MVQEIILKLQGGLGNQLFQYALARNIQLETGAQLIIDVSDFPYDKAYRSYSLEPFNIDKDNIIIDSSGKYNWKYDQRKNWIIKAGVKFAPNFLFNFANRFGIYIWEEIKYRKIDIDSHKRIIMLHGLWQSEDYFYTNRETIKKELKVITPISVKDKNLIDRMCLANSVCIHIRRGDFLKKSNNLCVCSKEYYMNAIKYIKKIVDRPMFYIFSDDIKDVKQSFNFDDENILFIEGNRKDYEEFRLMCSCTNFIISNSTFSWWASYLNGSNGVVIAPTKWYKDDTDISRLIRKDMICM